MKIKQQTVDKIIAWGHKTAGKIGKLIGIIILGVSLWVMMQIIVFLDWCLDFVIAWMR